MMGTVVVDSEETAVRAECCCGLVSVVVELEEMFVRAGHYFGRMLVLI